MFQNGKNTPLYAEHAQMGARMGEFGDTEVVLDYGKKYNDPLPLQEPFVADLSFQGTIRVVGASGLSFLQAMLTADIQQLEAIGNSCFSLMLTSQAEIIDIVYVIRTGSDEYILMVDAPVLDECMEWLKNNAHLAVEGQRVFPEVEVEDQSGNLGIICLMGPGALEPLAALAGIPANEIEQSDLAGGVRSGLCYTDAVGGLPMMIFSQPQVEGSMLLMQSPTATVALWQALLGFEQLQFMGFEQYVEVRKFCGLWLEGVSEGEYKTPQQAQLQSLLRKSGGFAGARALGM